MNNDDLADQDHDDLLDDPVDSHNAVTADLWMYSLSWAGCPPPGKTPQCPHAGLRVVTRPQDVGNEKSEKFIFLKISGVIRPRPWNWIVRAQTADPGMPDDLSQKFSFTVNLDILPDQFYIKDVN